MGRGATVPQSRIIINVTAVEEERPLTAMGRFFHEAVAVEPATGHVYETEDRGRPASSAGKGRARKGSPRRSPGRSGSNDHYVVQRRHSAEQKPRIAVPDELDYCCATPAVAAHPSRARQEAISRQRSAVDGPSDAFPLPYGRGSALPGGMGPGPPGPVRMAHRGPPTGDPCDPMPTRSLADHKPIVCRAVSIGLLRLARSRRTFLATAGGWRPGPGRHRGSAPRGPP